MFLSLFQTEYNFGWTPSRFFNIKIPVGSNFKQAQSAKTLYECRTMWRTLLICGTVLSHCVGGKTKRGKNYCQHKHNYAKRIRTLLLQHIRIIRTLVTIILGVFHLYDEHLCVPIISNGGAQLAEENLMITAEHLE